MLRYEDFVAQPQNAIQEIVGLVDEPAASLPFVDAQTVELGINHAVAANPSRFWTGRVELREDDQWLREPARLNRLVATSMSFPLLRRYGYPILPGPPHAIPKVRS
jgi:hypothetical protein